MNQVLLYVEDEEGDRELMRMAFKKEGAQASLRTVNNGKLALDYLTGSSTYADREAHPLPSVVLLDLNLPEIHGFDVLKWIRAHPLHCRLPVVVFSSSERREDRERANLLGANEFILKPNSANSFRDIARMLNERWLSHSNPLAPLS